MDRKTLRNYLAPAEAAGSARAGRRVTEADWRSLLCEWFPQLADTWLRQVSGL